MFTGIVQGRGVVKRIERRRGLHTLTIALPEGTSVGLEQGASVSVDGVCLTVADFGDQGVSFDVMQQTLNLTTLGELEVGHDVNIERAARDGAEIGGHALSGHVDTTARVSRIEQPENNYVLHFSVEKQWMKYLFAKGYVAINGTSLTIAEIDRASGTFCVWLIPETLRLTTFALKREGDRVNLEIERGTQVMVDTVRSFLEEHMHELLPNIKQSLLDDTDKSR